MKMENKKEDERTFEYDITNACSSGDCTGLIPSAPDSDEEYESYQAIYSFQPSKVADDPKSDKDSLN